MTIGSLWVILFKMNYADWEELFSLSAAALWHRLGEASALRERHFGRGVSFCVIINAKSGMCSEDCAFCSQSAKAASQAPHYPLLSQEELVAAARRAAAAGASRFSLVTAGRGVISPREQSAILSAVAAIREAVPIRVCASLGIVDRGFLTELKAAGLYRFHHNLETAASFFPRICTTHSFAERVATIEHAQEAGLSVCAGGIFGLGETLAQRWEMARTLQTLAVDAIPLNFLHPLAGTPLEHRPRLDPLTALKIVCAFRFTFPERSVIICGGRQVTLRSLSPLLFAAGADALMTGDYLTTRGRLPDDDRQMLTDLGLELVQETAAKRTSGTGFQPVG
ncbi:MAG: biotin synthase BioB [Deltaproteobacteria bacterium CG07_land_8_20_14_0_80_60_11]|nr:MAG: biotin synthase BioB [Deltaproteobacteria bacterium CG07_land_8_20_14_0_80_60_11]